MRVCLLNPNSTVSMTAAMVESAKQVAMGETVIEGLTASDAPATIEGYRDEALAAAAVVTAIEAHRDAFDAFIIACFGDPGLHAARELVEGPVVGIAEASFMLAITLGHRFAVIAHNETDVPEMEELVRLHGFDERCCGVRAASLDLAAADADPDRTLESFVAAGRTAIEIDGAEVLCLGCGPMLGYREGIESPLGVPVIEAVPAAVKVTESLLLLGHRTSKARAYRSPAKVSAS